MLKAREICNREAKGIPYVMIISYIIDKGQSVIAEITDEDINNLEGNAMMTADFCKDLVRAARSVVKECDQNDIIRLIKAEWCCSGEVYDPDKDQFVTDENNTDEYTWTEWKGAEPIIPDIRMRELAEQAICYIKDREELEDFCDECDIEFDEEERSYFGIYEEGEDE